jgi:hypothetical protein
MTTLGAWLVLAAGKICERSSGEWVKRRLAMLALGLVFGAIAFISSQHLLVTFGGRQTLQNLTHGGLLHGTFSSAGVPQIGAFLAYFGAVFVTIGWWKQVDPLRRSRLRIAPILIAILAAWIWMPAFPFPQPWGFMLIASIAIAAQLSACWFSPAERTAAISRRRA